MSNALKFGILYSGTTFQQWQVDAVRLLRSEGHELVLLIRDPRIRKSREFSEVIRSYPWEKLFFNLYHRYLLKSKAKQNVDISREMQGIPVISCEVECRGIAEYFSPGDVDKIRKEGLDFILRFAFNILRGDILRAARYGIWSFHHDDEMKYRGGPPGFWEIYHKDPVSGAILQRLTDKLDAGVVLKKGYLKTLRYSYRANLDQLLFTSSSWPLQVAEEIRNGRTFYPIPSLSNAAVFKLPGNLSMLRFLWKLSWNYVRFQFQDLFRAELWNIGVIAKPIEEIALGDAPFRHERIDWIPKVASGHYLADPYGYIDERKIHILLEDYSYNRGKATIAEVIYSPLSRSFSVPLSAIEGSKHLSYPFIIVTDQNNVFCVPESYRNRTVELYKRNFSEGSFLEEKVLIGDIDAVDPTLLRFGRYWWIFCTLRRTSNTHLHLFYAEDLRGPYIPHRMNPVKIDITSSRPGGSPFFHQGFLYRPAQDCSESYGRRLVINRIIKLTPNDFEEVVAKILDPPANSKYSRGMHTISSVGGYTLIDGKRYGLNRDYFFSQLRTKINRHLGKHA